MSVRGAGQMTSIPDCPVCMTNKAVREGSEVWTCGECFYSWPLRTADRYSANAEMGNSVNRVLGRAPEQARRRY